MDADRFDDMLRQWDLGRRPVIGVGLGALLGLASLAAGEAKKKKHKKKTCAKKCPNGCCTSKTGTCIQPEQQSLTQCGTGGAICRSTGCGGTCPNCGCSASKPCPDGQCCDGKGTCGACRVFVTSTKHNGDFDGLTGADAYCQNRATAAGLFGTYMAWLSDDTGSPSTRFTQATVPYVLVNGTRVAAHWTALTSETLANKIDVTEAGATNSNQVWTDTLPDGTEGGGGAIEGDCENWTSSNSGPGFRGNTGVNIEQNGLWTNRSARECNLEFPLYCFQQS